MPYDNRYSSGEEVQNSSSVVMVGGLHPIKMNCSRIFNLLCVYGNVGKVGNVSVVTFLLLGICNFYLQEIISDRSIYGLQS